MKVFFSGIGGIAVICALVVGLCFGSFELYKYFSPKYMEVDRNNFEASKSFVQGTVDEIEKTRTELELRKDAVERSALRRHILEVAARVDMSRLPQDTQDYVRRLRNDPEPIAPLQAAPAASQAEKQGNK